MSTYFPPFFVFNDFEFDAEKLILRHRGDLIEDAEIKSLQVLAALLKSPNELILYDDVIDSVWGDNPHGVTPTRVNHYTSRLQKLFARHEPDVKFIQNVRGRGYIFCGVVSEQGAHLSISSSNMDLTSPEDMAKMRVSSVAGGPPDNTSEKHVAEYQQRKILWLMPVGIATLAIILLAIWKIYPGGQEEEVKRVVKESQLFESLVLYKNPASFREDELDRYWTTELDLTSNFDRGRIREAVTKLNDENHRYGEETKCEQFDFQAVEINNNGDMAVAKTLEKWFVSIYSDDGILLQNRTIGPYFVSYVLRKVGGHWLIEKSTTARVNRPTPQIDNVEIAPGTQGNQQFFVQITGQDFEPELIYLEVTGPGCPANTPCRVPNAALRENAKMTATELSNVPLTLGSGEFRVIAHNGDSQPSNPARVTISK